MSFQQLTLEQRYHIQAKLEVSASYESIGSAIYLHKSTVNREINHLGRNVYSEK